MWNATQKPYHLCFSQPASGARLKQLFLDEMWQGSVRPIFELCGSQFQYQKQGMRRTIKHDAAAVFRELLA